MVESIVVYVHGMVLGVVIGATTAHEVVLIAVVRTGTSGGVHVMPKEWVY